jgi:hypothetical protein
MRMIECALRGRGGESGKKDSWHLILELGGGEIMYNITSVQKDCTVMEIYESEGSIRSFPVKR